MMPAGGRQARIPQDLTGWNRHKNLRGNKLHVTGSSRTPNPTNFEGRGRRFLHCLQTMKISARPLLPDATPKRGAILEDECGDMTGVSFVPAVSLASRACEEQPKCPRRSPRDTSIQARFCRS